MHRGRKRLSASSFIVLTILALPGSLAGEVLVRATGPFGGDVTALTVFDGKVFAGTGASSVIHTGGWVFSSSDDGATWTPSGEGLEGGYVTAFGALGSDLFVGTTDGVFRSSDGGSSWALAGDGVSSRPWDFTQLGTELFVATPQGVFKTSDGQTWLEANNGITNLETRSIAAVGSDLYVASNATVVGGTAQVFRSSTAGASWADVSAGITGSYVGDIVEFNGEVVLGLHQAGVYRSSDSGVTWVPENDGISSLKPNVYSLLEADGMLWAGYSEGVAHALAASASHVLAGLITGVTRSDDAGATWSRSVEGLAATSVLSLLVSSTEWLYAGTAYQGAFRSDDEGRTWEEINNGHDGIQVRAFTEAGGDLYMASWAHGVFKSTNAGDSWQLVDAGLSSTGPTSLATLGLDVFVGTIDGGVYRLSAGAPPWQEASTGLTSLRVEGLVAAAPDLYAATADGVFRSTDGGGTWAPFSSGLAPLDLWVRDLAVVKGQLFAMPFSGRGLYRTPLGTASWEQIQTGYFAFLAAGPSAIYLGVSRELHKSVDGGETLAPMGTGVISKYQAFAFGTSHIIAGTDSRGVILLREIFSAAFENGDLGEWSLFR